MRGAKPARSRESGAIAIIMTFCLTFMMGFAAIGFDLSYVRLARLEMKSATDAAAHAAVLMLRQTTGNQQAAQKAAESVAAANTVLGKPMHLQDSDIVFGSWSTTTQTFTLGDPVTAVKIKAVRESSSTDDGYVQLTFGKALGYTESSVTQDTIGSFVDRNFMVEFDITPSYICNIDNAVKAVLNMLSDLHDRNIGGDQISLDVFTGKAVEFTPFQNIRALYPTIRDTWSGGMPYVGFAPPDTVSPSVKTTGITVCNKLDDWTKNNGGSFGCPDDGAKTTGPYPYPNNPNIMACSSTDMTGYSAPVFAGTDIAAAIRAGTQKLIDKTGAGKDYQPRIIIVVTDGEPMMCTAPQGGDLCWKGGSPCCNDGWCNITNADNADQTKQPGRSASCRAAHDQLDDGPKAAQAAADLNIDIFMVKLRGSATDSSAQYAQSLVKGRGTFTWLVDATQLSGAFTKIIGQVPVSLVK
jgi:Flp pilus assembly protein TadG